MAQYDLLFEQIHASANLLYRGMHFARKAHMQEEGHTPLHRGQGRVLRALLRQDGISQKELVELLDIRPSSLGELVDKLEQAGLVRRSQSEEDKRVSIVHLTETGRERAEGMQSSKEELLGSLLAGLTEEEQETLLQLLTKLNGSLKERFPASPERPEHRHGPNGGCGRHGHGPHGGGPWGPHGQRS